jgi:hypothetical protein
MSSTHPFLQSENGTMLQRVLYKDIVRRYGGDLNEKQASRLIKTVTYWTSEVYRVQGNKPTDVLNKEVFRLVLTDYMSYLERHERSSVRSVVSDIEEGPGVVKTTSGVIEDVTRDVRDVRDVTRMDVGNAFTALQAQRQEGKQPKAAQRDFRIDIQEEGTISLDIFERIKRDREQEAERSLVQIEDKPNPFVNAVDLFSSQSKKAQEEAEAAFAERERNRLVVRASAELPVPPDMRAILLGDGGGIDRMKPRENEQYATLANLPQAIMQGQQRGQQGQEGQGQQAMITRQPDVVSYRESEINLFISSADRDWTSVGAGTKDSRYNFTILFDPASLPATKIGTSSSFPSQRLVTPGSLANSVLDSLDTKSNIYPNPTIFNRFRNIVRIEFVKAILPGEGLDVFLTKTGATAYDTSLNMNVLSFPYIQVRIPELETNNYGTNQAINTSFALLQYDANWVNDTNNEAQRGYFAMIPKFLKCQKVYTPSPLATLQKLSFQFQRPDGSILSSIPDTLSVSTIIPTNCIYNGVTGLIASTGTRPIIYTRDNTLETNGAAYYWIQTSTWFNKYTVSKGDRIAVKNISWDLLNEPTNPANPTQVNYATGATLLAQISDIIGVIQNTTGLLVANIGTIVGSGAGAVMVEGANSSGYANAIIVSGKFTDPTTGGTSVATSPGGVPDLASGFAATNPITSPSAFMAQTPVTTGTLINLSHQTHIVMRIITRDADSTGLIRADNL